MITALYILAGLILLYAAWVIEHWTSQRIERTTHGGTDASREAT